MMNKTKAITASLIILIVLILDQTLKIWVKTHFYLGEDLQITSWFHLLFVENNGMAFGMEVGSKLFLSVFRIAALFAGIWYLGKIMRNPAFPTGFAACIALIIAGTAGNIIDCLFYGIIFNNPLPPEVAVIFPPDGGYAPIFHGRVVDMLYFPLFSFNWPAWLPLIGGKEFLFFQPVFNIADAAISVGIIAILLFYSSCFARPVNPVAEAAEADKEADKEADDEA